MFFFLELDLAHCRYIQQEGFSYLENLEHLEYLRIGFIYSIKTRTLCKILQNNQQMRELHLNMTYVNITTVATKLRNLCPNLEVISLIYCRYVRSSRAINHVIIALAACKNLRKIILHM